MSDPINKRVLDYDTFNELPPNSYLLVDSESMGTGKVAPLQIGATYEIQDGAHSFTLVGSNGYSHTVDIPYDSVQMSYADYNALTELQKMDGTNRFVPDVPTDDLEPEIWQRVGRTPLTTEEKTISPAINELKGRIDNSDTEIENVKSNLTELLDWKYAGYVSGTTNYVTYPETAKELNVIVAWANTDLTYGYTFNIPILSDNSTRIYRSGAYGSSSETGSAVIDVDFPNHRIKISGVRYNGNTQTGAMKVFYR